MSKTAVMALVPVLLAVACLRSGGGATEAVDPELARRGAAYYSDWGCGACHGDLGRGTDEAPSLAGLGDRWTVDDLAEYLLDPQSYATRDARVRELQDRYPDMEMPAFEFPGDQRRAVATWVLTLER